MEDAKVIPQNQSILYHLRRGLFGCVRFILDYDPSMVHERDRDGKTPLSNCSFIEDDKWAKSLAHLFLENGAEICDRDLYGLTALHYACLYERVDLVELYLTALDYNLNLKDKGGHTALFYAAHIGNFKILRMLVDCMKKFRFSVDVPNKFGITPLIEAWKCGNFECGEYLLDEGGADDSIYDKMCMKSAKVWEQEARAKQSLEKELRKRRRVQSAPLIRVRPQRRTKKVNEYDLMEKDDRRILRVVHMEFPSVRQRENSYQGLNLIECQDTKPTLNWRGHLRSLYPLYEVHNTASFRNNAKPIEINPPEITVDEPPAAKACMKKVSNALLARPASRMKRNSMSKISKLTGSTSSLADSSSSEGSVSSRRNDIAKVAKGSKLLQAALSALDETDNNSEN